jgi:sensor histidine kinase YesM
MLQDNSFLKDFVVLGKYRLLRHAVLLLFLFVNLFLWDADLSVLDGVALPNSGNIQISTVVRNIKYFSFFIFIVASLIVYFNLYFLVPRLFLTYKYAWYTCWVLVLCFIFFFATYQGSTLLFESYKMLVYPVEFTLLGFMQQIITPLAFLGATTGVKIFKLWMLDTERFAALKNTELQNELTLLKNQVNPHFLFNTLNNIRTLNEIDTKKANQVLLGLSDILRYQIYDSNKEQTRLAKDIAILDDYLLLEKIRRDNFTYQIVVDGDSNTVMIPPLLFINFVENAIKHGASARDISFCNLHFNILNDQLEFTCTNSKPTVSVNIKGGVGIKNIERRLQLLYPGTHKLTITDESNLYTVKLSIPI